MQILNILDDFPHIIRLIFMQWLDGDYVGFLWIFRLISFHTLAELDQCDLQGVSLDLRSLIKLFCAAGC